MSDFKDRFHHHVPGLNNASSYMSSGHPYVTGAMISAPEDAWPGHPHTIKVSFPRVTKSFTVINTDEIFTGSAGEMGFTNGGSTAEGAFIVHFVPSASAIPGNHFITIPNNGNSFTFDVKCKEVYLTNIETAAAGDAAAQLARSASFQLVAELTSIPVQEMFHLTGSGLTEWEGIHS